MLKGKLITILIASLISSYTFAASETNEKYYGSEFYGHGLCDNPKFTCEKLTSSKSWEALFPDERERNIVQKLNRFDTYPYAGRTIAIPKDLKNTTIFDISPFPLRIEPPKRKLIIIDQNRLAWAAYAPDGNLVKWGPVSSGRDYCADVHRNCRTITGEFHVFHRKGKACKSSVFPVGRGGSSMPYCMFFYKGFAMHGSHEVVGKRASHGCVRMFTRDAMWLNHDFVEPATKEGYLGTRVIVQKIVETRDEDKNVKSN